MVEAVLKNFGVNAMMLRFWFSSFSENLTCTNLRQIHGRTSFFCILPTFSFNIGLVNAEMDDEEEKMCLLSEHDDCGAGIAAAIGGHADDDDDEPEHGEIQFNDCDQDQTDPNRMSDTMDSDAVMVVNDIISDIEDKPCAGLSTSRSLPTAIHGYDCEEADRISAVKDEDGSGSDCHRCVSPRPSSMSFREARSGRGGEPLIVDVHLPPQRHAEHQRATPSVPMRPCKHAINRSQKCISDVSNTKSRIKDDRVNEW